MDTLGLQYTRKWLMILSPSLKIPFSSSSCRSGYRSYRRIRIPWSQQQQQQQPFSTIPSVATSTSKSKSKFKDRENNPLKDNKDNNRHSYENVNKKEKSWVPKPTKSNKKLSFTMPAKKLNFKSEVFKLHQEFNRGIVPELEEAYRHTNVKYLTREHFDQHQKRLFGTFMDHSPCIAKYVLKDTMVPPLKNFMNPETTAAILKAIPHANKYKTEAYLRDALKRFILPTSEEILAREQVIQDLTDFLHSRNKEFEDLSMLVKDVSKQRMKARKKAKKKLGDAELARFEGIVALKNPTVTFRIVPFGSQATDMYLRGADIDLVFLWKVHNKEKTVSIDEIDPNMFIYAPTGTAESMLRKTWWKFIGKDVRLHENKQLLGLNSVEYIQASTPLIKAVHGKTNIKLDMSCGKGNGVWTSVWINEYLAASPSVPIREVTMLLKQLLKTNNLNVPFEYGVGGFGVAISVIHVYEQYFDKTAPTPPKVSELFLMVCYHIGFIQPLSSRVPLRSRDLPAPEWIVELQEEVKPPVIVPKRMTPSSPPVHINIRDPLDKQNNIAKNFAFAQDWSRLCREVFGTCNEVGGNSLFDKLPTPINRYRGVERREIVNGLIWTDRKKDWDDFFGFDRDAEEVNGYSLPKRDVLLAEARSGYDDVEGEKSKWNWRDFYKRLQEAFHLPDGGAFGKLDVTDRKKSKIYRHRQIREKKFNIMQGKRATLRRKGILL